MSGHLIICYLSIPKKKITLFMNIKIFKLWFFTLLSEKKEFEHIKTFLCYFLKTTDLFSINSNCCFKDLFHFRVWGLLIVTSTHFICKKPLQKFRFLFYMLLLCGRNINASKHPITILRKISTML